MGIDLPPHPLTTNEELVALIDRVVAAQENDECLWVEWKSDLDLGSKAGQFAVARGILGMSNRIPSDVSHKAGGQGFFVVGATHDGIFGARIPDPADIIPRLRSYLGARVQFDLHGVRYDGKDVLVAVVAPPALGDRINALRRQFSEGADGTVFVRHPGATRPADSGDLERLQDRLLGANHLDLAVDVKASALDWIDMDALSVAVDAALAESKATLLSSARAQVAADTPSASGPSDALLKSIAATITSPWPSIGDYSQKLEEWIEESREPMMHQVLGAVLADPPERVHLEVRNTGRSAATGVGVKFDFSGDWTGLVADEGWEETLPDPPTFERTNPFPLALELQGAHAAALSASLAGILQPADIYVDEAVTIDGRIVTVEVGRLRPDESDHNDLVVLLGQRPDSGTVEVRWAARSESHDGVQRGVVAVAVNEVPLDAEALVARCKIT